jgi:hypothetical protein
MPISALGLLLVLLAPATVERVLAVVNGRPLLLSETRTVAVLRGVGEEAALDLLIDEALMYEQASLTPQATVGTEEIEKASLALLEKRPELADAVSGKDLSRLLARQMAILKYVEFRFRPQVRPSDEDLQRAYADEYEGRPEAPAFDTVAEALRERLSRRQLDLKVEEWVRELRGSAEVRRLGPPAATDPAARRRPAAG